MFAGMFYERDPLKLENLPSGFIGFLQDAGGFAAVALAIWLVWYFAALRESDPERRPRGTGVLLFKLATIACFLSYIVYAVMWALSQTSAGVGANRRLIFRMEMYGLTLGGICALIAVLIPFLADLIHFRARRIWALARLSFKEAVRRKVLWVFLAMLLVLLFASWFIQSKSEDQVRTYVQVVSFSMSVLLLLVAGLLAAFGIPTDMRQQTIHTILTKPVERFEVVIGRFLGYMMLLTLVLVVVSGLSLLYVLRSIDPDAERESLKARETLYGDLEFEGTKDKNKATNVGNEWDYRTYIYGPVPQEPPQLAVWKFEDVKGLADRKKVRCEFGFDIYRTTKGQIGVGVFCTFLVHTPNFDPSKRQDYDRERRDAKQKPGADADEIDNRLAEKYGCYVVSSKEIRNLHTYFIDIPGGIFKNAAESTTRPRRTEASTGMTEPAPVVVKVKCESRTQYVGMAKYDLYLRPDHDYTLSEDELARRDRLRFMWNFAKGQTGLWFRLCLVVGIAVALSTYLSGLISFLAASFFYLGGLCREFIRSLGEGTAPVGGPFESGYRLAMRDLGSPMDETAGFRVVAFSDNLFRWVARRVLNILPDVDRFDLSINVAEGFNIAGGQLTMTGLMLLSYMLLAALAAYYLMKWREIASTM
jgi:hypothetical protein